MPTCGFVREPRRAKRRVDMPLKNQLAKPRILVVRNDKIGDFMLAWPALALLRRSMPDAHISVLVPAYTRDLARCCPWIDEVLLDPADLRRMNRENFDLLLTLFSTPRIAWSAWKGRIPLRVAPATKWAQVFYNHRVRQRRSQSRKPEYEYNLELAAYAIKLLGGTVASNPAAYWPLAPDTRLEQRRQLAQRLDLPLDRPWVFVHAGSGGSAVNLSVGQYASLIKRLQQIWPGQNPPSWILTAGPGEQPMMQALLEQVCDAETLVRPYLSTEGLATFAQSLCCADVFVAGSTGPLHVAGALNVPTVGFFPVKRSATALRWRPCNGPGRTLAISAPQEAAEQENPMAAIDMEAAAQEIRNWQLGLASLS